MAEPAAAQHDTRVDRAGALDGDTLPAPAPTRPLGGWVVPASGLVRGSGPGAVRRSAGTLDPLGGSRVDQSVDAALARRRGGGSPLPTDVAHAMGSALGADLRNVRVHTGDEPARLARSVQALAFTHGTDIYFGAGKYAPDTGAGQRLLAHELAHTVHDVGRSAAGPPVIGRATDPAEADADRTAESVMAVLRRCAATGPQSVSRIAPSTRPAGLGTLRRAGDKIAFEAAGKVDEADQALVKQIADAITSHQVAKRDYKNEIESDKDRKIEQTDDADQDTRIAALKTFHNDYKSSGWDLKKLSDEILTATKRAVTIGAEEGDEIPIISNASGETVYRILLRQARFRAPADSEKEASLANPFVVKKGTTKQYVHDARDLSIGRFVYRGCDFEQMTQLFTKGEMLPRNTSDKRGDQFDLYKFKGGDRNSALKQEEKLFLQQRDGSGPNQRLLSATHAGPNRKVYSNHGKVFTSEAAIKVDLAKIEKSKIFDIHLEESHASKVAYGRKEQGDWRATTDKKERDLYVYSAEKNRETLLTSLPLAAVVEVSVDGNRMSLEDANKRFNRAVILAEQEKQRQAQAEAKAAAEKRQAEAKAAAEKRQAEAKAAAEKSQAEAEKAERKSEQTKIAATEELRRKAVADKFATLLAKDSKWKSDFEDEISTYVSDPVDWIKTYEESMEDSTEFTPLDPKRADLAELRDVLQYIRSMFG